VQSGFINEIGFDTYQKILNEAIDELKENEFKELYKEENKDKDYVKNIVIETDIELLFPDDYINNIAERLNLYTQLNNLKTEEEIKVFEKELMDRFGELPTQVIDLLNSVRIKWIATKLGFEKIIMKQNRFIGYFISDQQSDFYKSAIFTRVLKFVQSHPNVCKMKEKETRKGLRLLLTFENVNSIEKALRAIQPILA
jgi:transcription-repair coupling factor (superfamily II helicase)